MAQYSWPARVYILAVPLLGLLLAGLNMTFFWQPPTAAQLWLLPVFFVAFSLSNVFVIELPHKVNMTVGSGVSIACLALLGPAYAALFSAVGVLLGDTLLTRRKAPWYKILFNAGLHVSYVSLAGIVYDACQDGNGQILDSWRDIAAIVLASLTLYAANSLLIALVLALTERIHPWKIWRRIYSDVLPQYLAMLPMGVAVALLWSIRPWSIILAVIPLVILRQNFKVTFELQRQTEEVLLALADTLDNKDQYTSHHTERVSEYATVIARAMALPDKQIELIATAARLHDLGKVGIPDEVLNKPSRLNADETTVMQRHPELGVKVLGHLSMLHDHIPIVRHHHEHYDGSGYPDGLKGEEIPLGARIVLVADAWDAMTSDRVYRKALPRTKAIQVLKDFSGVQFDPLIVGAFLKWLADEESRQPVPLFDPSRERERAEVAASNA